MLLLPLVGYATYGDRPPAGWPAIDAISLSSSLSYASFVGEFLLLFLPGLVSYAALALGGVRLQVNRGVMWPPAHSIGTC